jgi:ferredoxin
VRQTLQSGVRFGYNYCMPTIEFLNEGTRVNCGQYANLRKVALLHGVEVYKGVDRIANCRGNGLCGTCVMEIVEGLENISTKTLREQFKLKGKPANYRLSCQSQVLGDIVCITAPAMDEAPVAPART